MSDKINHLKKLRLAKGYTQQDVCSKLNMSRSKYSKIENEIIMPSFYDLENILDILGLRLADYVKEIENTDTFSHYFYIYFIAFTGQRVAKSEIRDLSLYVDFTKEKNNRSLSLYGLVKYMLQSKFPKIISEPTKSDEALIIRALKKISKPLAFYDIKLISNFGALLLSPKKQIEFLRPLLPFSPNNYLENKADYSLEVNKIYNNFCDIAITNREYEWATELLAHQDNFQRIYIDLRYIHYKEVNKETLRYHLTHDHSCINNIRLIATYFDIVKDYDTAESLRKQANELKDMTYISGKDIVRDR